MDEQEQSNIPPVETPNPNVREIGFPSNGDLGSEKKHKLTPFLITIVALVLIAGGVLAYIYSTITGVVVEEEITDKVVDEVITENNIIENPDVNIPKEIISEGPHTYNLEPALDDNQTFEESFDLKLVSYDEFGQKNVLVDSVKQSIPELQEKFNLIIGRLSYPSESDKLFFKSFYDGTDSGTQALYSFDLKTKTFSKMKSTQYYAQWGENLLSPDGLKIASVENRESENDNKIYVIYLNEDRVETVVSLQGNEKIVKGYNQFAGSPIIEISWIDNNTIEYDVFEEEVDREPFQDNTFIDKRSVYIP